MSLSPPLAYRRLYQNNKSLKLANQHNKMNQFDTSLSNLDIVRHIVDYTFSINNHTERTIVGHFITLCYGTSSSFITFFFQWIV